MHKLTKKLFLYTRNTLGATQVALIFLAFFTTLYWILELAQVPFIKNFSVFFAGIYDFVHLFYNRTVSYEEVSVDYSYFIASIIMLGMAWAITFITLALKTLELRYDNLHNTLKMAKEEKFNKSLYNQHLTEEKKIKDYVFLINTSCSKQSSNLYGNRNEVRENEIEIKEKVVAEMLEVIKILGAFELNKTTSGILLTFHNFETIDRTFYLLQETLRKIQEKYAESKWIIDFYVAADILRKKEDLKKAYIRLSMLCKLRIANSIISQAELQSRYNLIDNPKFTIDTIGIYKIGDTEENVYEVKRKLSSQSAL